MDKSDSLYLASMCSMIQELMRQRRVLDSRIDELFDELCNEAWFSDYIIDNQPTATPLRLIIDNTPDDYKMD